MSYHYLATPYSKYAGGIVAAFEEACRQTAMLVRAGVPVFCPIAHSHPLAEHGELDAKDHELWMAADRPMMEAARGLIVCMMDGWKESYGVHEELKYFTRTGKPVIYMIPGIIPPELQPRQRVIGLTGYARSGKDTAAKALLGKGFRRVAFADAVREALWRLNPLIEYGEKVYYLTELMTALGSWEALKALPEVRRLLQRMGTEAGRNIHGLNCWVEIARQKIAAMNADVVITDVRFDNEIQLIRDLGGKVIWIDRPGVGPANEHISEQLGSAKREADYIVWNDSAESTLQERIVEAVCA